MNDELQFFYQLQYSSESYFFKKCNLKKVLPIMFFVNLVWPSFCRLRQTNEIKSHDFVAVKKLSAEQKIETEKNWRFPDWSNFNLSALKFLCINPKLQMLNRWLSTRQLKCNICTPKWYLNWFILVRIIGYWLCSLKEILTDHMF